MSALLGSRRLHVVCTVALTLASALFLAWSAQLTLGPIFSAPPAFPASMTVRVLSEAEKNPAAFGAQARILGILVDGRRLAGAQMAREGSWRELGSTQWEGIVHDADNRAASLQFHGTRACILFNRSLWSGRVRLERDGELLDQIDLYSPATPAQDVVELHPRFVQKLSRFVQKLSLTDYVVGEIPPTTCPAWTFWVFLSAALAVAAALRPWMSELRVEGWLLFLLTMLHLLVWGTQTTGTNNDATGYLAEIHGMVEDGMPGYSPPGYILLMATMQAIPFGLLGAKICLLQHAMMVATVLWLHRLLRQGLPGGAALLGALLAGCSWGSLFLPQTILSENLALFGMVGSIYFGVRFRDGLGCSAALLSGVLCGLAVLTRIVPLAAVVPGLLAVHLLPFSRRGLKRVGILLAVISLVLCLPLSWFWIKSGSAQLSTSTGLHLFNRVVTSQKKLSEKGPAAYALLRLLEGQDPRGLPHWDVRGVLEKKGLEYTQVELLFREVALEVIRESPVEFVLFSLQQAWRGFRGDAHWGVPRWGDTLVAESALEAPAPASLSRSGLTWRLTMERIHSATWPWFCWLAVAGAPLLYVLRRRAVLFAVLWLPAGDSLATACVEYFVERYNVAVIPIVIALAPLPLVAFVQVVRRRSLRSQSGGTLEDAAR